MAGDLECPLQIIHLIALFNFFLAFLCFFWFSLYILTAIIFFSFDVKHQIQYNICFRQCLQYFFFKSLEFSLNMKSPHPVPEN